MSDGAATDTRAEMFALHEIIEGLDSLRGDAEVATGRGSRLHLATERAYYEAMRAERERFGCQMCESGTCPDCKEFRMLQVQYEREDDPCNCGIGGGDQHSPKCGIWKAKR